MNMKTTVLLSVLVFAVGGADAATESTLDLSEFRANGAFGFPQREAKVLCDDATLRLSVWSNEEYLFAQAVLWTDDDATLGRTEDNREIGDWSNLQLDLDADRKATPRLDRNYTLNPWPGMEGLHYSVYRRGQHDRMQKDSKGHGAIRYVKISGNRQVRVDVPDPGAGN
jgi:hypothetical protein